jgi:ABC transporter with metal-binding/Fe-S-binding domain ATP-binding protein
MFSGGKDSTYAIHWAVFKGFEVTALLTLIPMRDDSWMFQWNGVNMTSHQASAMGIRQLMWNSSGMKDLELQDLMAAFKKLREEGVEGIVTGALLSDYQRLNINLIASIVGLKVYSPLWRKDQVRYMHELLRHGFRYIITSASAYGFPFHLVGKEIESEVQVRELVDAAQTYGFNPAFEGGEAETFVTYAPLFSRRLRVEGRAIKEGEFRWRFEISHIH